MSTYCVPATTRIYTNNNKDSNEKWTILVVNFSTYTHVNLLTLSTFGVGSNNKDLYFWAKRVRQIWASGRLRPEWQVPFGVFVS
jgi:hypothetical protein